MSKPDADRIGTAAFSTDGRYLAVLIDGRDVELLEAATGGVLANFEAPQRPIISWLRFSPDGTQLAALQFDRNILVWDLRRIRQELAERNLDWDAPPFPPRPRRRSAIPLEATLRPFGPDALRELIPPRDLQTKSNLIDLTAYFNAPLTKTWHTQGADELLGVTNDLSALPSGLQSLDGTQFDIRGIIQLTIPGWPGRYPDQVTGISVNQRCRRLHFLHATAWVVHDGTLIGRYVIHYEDGERAEIPIRYGDDVRDWWVWPGDPGVEAKNSIVAWRGANGATAAHGYGLRVFKSTWENPSPTKPIISLDYETTGAPSAPFLLAITAECSKAVARIW